MTQKEWEEELHQRSKLDLWEPLKEYDTEFARERGYRLPEQPLYMRFGTDWHYITYFDDARQMAGIATLPSCHTSRITFYALQGGLREGYIELSLQRPEYAFEPKYSGDPCGEWADYLLDHPPHLAHLNEKKDRRLPNLKKSC